MSQDLPLSGLRVVDYSHFLAGPFVGRSLAALGAEVIKIERPKEGDAGRKHAYLTENGQSGYFLQQNMGKLGLCINLKDPRGLALLHKLIDTADIFVENYRPGVLEKLGLGYKQLSERNPSLVYCSVSAYGHTGPDSHRPGFGLVAEAKSGIMQMIGSPGEAPPPLRIALGDMYTGLYGVASICAALFGRVKSGRGQHIDLALYDCLVSMHEYAVQCYTLSGGKELPVQTGNDLPQSTLYGVFTATDGYVVIAAQADDAWKRFAGLIGDEAFAADTRLHTSVGRNTHRDEILPVVEAWVEQHSVEQCLSSLDAIDVPCAKIQRIDEVLADPQIIDRGMMIEQEHPILGRVKLPNLPFRFSAYDIVQKMPAPLLGQHNRVIARSLGYSDTEIDTLIADDVLYTEEAVGTLQK